MKSNLGITFFSIYLAICAPYTVCSELDDSTKLTSEHVGVYSALFFEVMAPSEATSQYLDAIFTSRKLNSVSRAHYVRTLKQFMQWTQAHNIQAPSEKDVESYRDTIVEKNVSPCTINSYLVSLRVVFNDLHEMNLYPNVMRDIPLNKIPLGSATKFINYEDILGVLESIDSATLTGKRDKAVLSLVFFAGLRIQEVVNLKIENIIRNLTGCELAITHNEKQKTTYISLSNSVMEILDDYIFALKKYLKKKTNSSNKISLKKSSPLFISFSSRNYGHMLTTRSVSRIIKEAWRAMGVDEEKLSAQNIRASAIKFSLLAGATVEEASKFARFQCLSSIKPYLDPEKPIESVTEKMERYLKENSKASKANDS